jgi:alkaline phosphatase
MKKFLLTLAVILVTMTAGAKAPKYVFYFIGDGMGTNEVVATQMYMSDIEGTIGFKPLCFAQFPYTGIAFSYAANTFITDSAAAGTALASGKKTNSGMLGMLPDRESAAESIAEMAKKAGKKVGIGTTVCINHATPGAFYAHQLSRNNYHAISNQLAESGFDFFGGGHFSSAHDRRFDDGGSYKVAEDAGYTIALGYDEYKANAESTDKIIVFPQQEGMESLKLHIDSKEDDLTLAQLTESAIEFLMKDNKKGFFMMMEGGKIDHSGHGNDAASTIQEVIGFDNAIKVAYEFYKQHPKETLIVVTADHETGGMSMGINGQYRMNLQALQYQNMSEDAFSTHLEELGRKVGDVLTWEEVEAELKEHFGFWDKVRLSRDQENRLRSAYVETFGMGESAKKAEEYYSVNKLSDLAVQIMSEVALVGWSSGAHTAAYVPVFAIGVGAENFTGQMDNIDIPMKIAEVANY